MTSELLIMTPSAVALAADSAVTVGNKIYTGVNKLFMLSNKPSIGIMIFNNSNFMGIPLETIIKEFRKHCSNTDLETLKEFQLEFDNFLKTLIPKSNFKLNMDDLITSFMINFKDEFNININSINDFSNLVNSIVSSLNEDMLSIIPKDIIVELNENKFIFEKLIPNFEDCTNKNELVNNLLKILINQQINNNFTGIVMAGFEKGQLFPAAIEFKISYWYDDKFMVYSIHEEAVGQKDENGEKTVLLKPFAQGDVILTFLTSIDDSTKLEILSFFKEINTKYMDNFKNQINNNPNFSKDIKEEIFNEINSFENEKRYLPLQFNQFIEELITKKTNPILNSIASLPYEELSNLSESLIKVTSLKRKVQSDLESVGGEVDVAIITKGDGFIWTKRKHYFDAKYNYQFFDR